MNEELQNRKKAGTPGFAFSVVEMTYTKSTDNNINESYVSLKIQSHTDLLYSGGEFV